MLDTVKVLMRRDGITKEEAMRMVKECYNEIMEYGEELDPADIIMDMLGLEPDYIVDILSWELAIVK